VLEDANSKLASVATDVMGKSGRAILAALLAGERDPEVLAELSKGRLRNKKEDLKLALEGLFRPHHVLLLTQIFAHIDYLEESIAQLEAEIERLRTLRVREVSLSGKRLSCWTRSRGWIAVQRRISLPRWVLTWATFRRTNISVPGRR